MNNGLNHLKQYPFARLNAALEGLVPAAGMSAIDLSIGEPQQQPPEFILDALRQALPHLASYPSTHGLASLRQAQADWLGRRLKLPVGSIDPNSQVLPVNGTREALFAFAQCVVAQDAAAIVCMANPYYQIYQGAALLAGAKCHFIPRRECNSFAPDYAEVDTDTWHKCQLLYICTPDNPTGQCIDKETLDILLQLADEHDFFIAADECYLDIYPDEQAPPPGVLELCQQLGRSSYDRVVSFNSLSKRSGVPGLRSGFVAGDAALIKNFLAYRTYHGSAMSLPTQYASIAAWQDDAHAAAHRQMYREKFNATLPLLKEPLQCKQPEGGFYLWGKTPGNDLQFAKQLYGGFNVRLLPGRLLSQPDDDTGSGAGWVRIALVSELHDCIDAAERILQCLRQSA